MEQVFVIVDVEVTGSRKRFDFWRRCGGLRYVCQLRRYSRNCEKTNKNTSSPAIHHLQRRHLDLKRVGIVREGSTHIQLAKTSFESYDGRDGHGDCRLREIRCKIAHTNSELLY